MSDSEYKGGYGHKMPRNAGGIDKPLNSYEAEQNGDICSLYDRRQLGYQNDDLLNVY